MYVKDNISVEVCKNLLILNTIVYKNTLQEDP